MIFCIYSNSLHIKLKAVNIVEGKNAKALLTQYATHQSNNPYIALNSRDNILLTHKVILPSHPSQNRTPKALQREMVHYKKGKKEVTLKGPKKKDG